MEKVAVIILNYKVPRNTIKCLKSVKKSTYPEVEIIVVNNSPGDSLSEDMKKFPKVFYLENQENLGYSDGNNKGIIYALSQNFDFIFVLNPDMEVEPECITNLIKIMKDSTIGIVGPKILFADKKTIWYAGGIFDLDNVLGSHRGVDEKDHGQYETTEETGCVSGGAMFIRSTVFKKIGFFDGKYFLYYEDSDFCFRAKKAGFKLIYAPRAVAFHENAKSTGLGSPLQDYFITRNRMIFASKFLSLRTRFALFREALKNILNPVRRLALYDYLVDNLGKGSYIK